MDNKNTSERLAPYKNQILSMSNMMIRSRSKTTLLESKIELLALHHLINTPKYIEKTDEKGVVYTVRASMINISEIKKLLGRNDHVIYSEVMNCAYILKSKVCIFEDRENNRFVMKSLYGDVTYNKGKVLFEYNPDMSKLYTNLTKNFTQVELALMFGFKKNGAFQLYKLLKSYAYTPNLPTFDEKLSQDELPGYTVSFTPTDFRMLLGFVNIDQDELRKEAWKAHPDFDKMLKDENNPQYKRWTDFKRRVIIPGIKEINDTSDIYISEIQESKSGCGGRTDVIYVTVKHNQKYYLANKEKEKGVSVKKILTEDEKEDFAGELLRTYSSFPLRFRDWLSISAAADYDLSRIRTAAEVLSTTPNVTSPCAFLISAIKERWEPNNTAGEDEEDAGTPPADKSPAKIQKPSRKKTTPGSPVSANTTRAKKNTRTARSPKTIPYNNYSQRNYTKDELNSIERLLLKRSGQMEPPVASTTGTEGCQP